MKIGIFDPYLDTLGGGEKYMLTIAKYLSKTHDVSLFWDTDIEKIKDLAFDRFGLDLSSIRFVKNIFSPRVSVLERVQITMRHDRIIYLSDGSLPIVGKKNLIIHFQFPVEWVHTSLLTRLKFLQVKSIICNSKFTKSFIDKKFNVKSNVLYPPVDLPKEKVEKKENIILHVGRFGLSIEGTNFKKQDVMIEIFKKLIKEGMMGWRFVIFVSVRSQDREKIKDLRRKTDNFPIDIIENASNSTLWEMYQKAKIYWHATGFGEDLLRHPERAEHFGIATAEAMGAGAVPVVINAGGQPEIVENGKSGFLWNTQDEWIEKTKQIATDLKLWQQMSHNAHQRAKVFNTEHFSKEVEQLISA